MVSWAGKIEVEREGFIAQRICQGKGDLDDDDDAAYKEKEKKIRKNQMRHYCEMISCMLCGVKNDKGRQTILYLVSRS